MTDVITSTFSVHDVGPSAQCRKMKRTYVKPVSSASKTGSHPNLGGPRAGTILPSVRPSKRIGSVLGPALYAKVQSAHAARVGKPLSMRLRPGLSQSVINSGSIPSTTQQRSVRGPRPRAPSPKPHIRAARKSCEI
jgi:hypothetical protein